MSESELQAKIENLEKQIHDLEKDLIHDFLTGLKTRAFFEEETNTYLRTISNLEEGKRREWFGFKTLSFVLFDIDNFKKINDTYGHSIGDQVLKEVAFLIQKSVREGDTVSRWGGEEIAVCLLGANEVDARDKAENIRRMVEKLTFSHETIKVTISAGVAMNWKDATYEELLKRVDKALYQAKETGRNKVVAFSEVS